jgi:hypothetical protein
MFSLVRPVLATLAVAAIAISVAFAPVPTASAAEGSTAVAAKSAKGWPRYMDRIFLNGCGHTALCRDALHWLERHYSLRQVARHADNSRWINRVAHEALNAVL